MTRWKASAIHLALSVLVLSTIAAVLVWRWYPPGLFQTARADKLFMIIAIVDVVVGPLLTLVVYKQGKKTLEFDLAVVALLQLAAMGYGLHTVWESRPVYLVAAVDRFQLVFANELDTDDLKGAPPQYQKLPLLGAKTIGTVPPKDDAERLKIILSTVEGKDIHLIPARYVPYDSVAKNLAARAMPAAELVAALPAPGREAINAAIQDRGREATDIVAVPISSVRGDATMLLDAHDGSIVGPVAVDPWHVFSAWAGRKAAMQKSALATPSP